jgi:hypothetical protein
MAAIAVASELETQALIPMTPLKITKQISLTMTATIEATE